MAKDTKNTAKKPVSREIPVSGTPTGDTGVLTHEPKAYAILRDRRNRWFGHSGLVNRTPYRNCLYPEKVTFRNYYDMYSRNNVAACDRNVPDHMERNAFGHRQERPKSRFSSQSPLLNMQIPWQDGLKQSLLTSLISLDVRRHRR